MEDKYYYILGLDQQASELELDGAYMKLMAQLNEGEDAFIQAYKKRLEQAYEHLKKQYTSTTQEQFIEDLERPVVHSFLAAKSAIYPDELLTISWETVHADRVYLVPGGRVDSSGTKSIRFYNWDDDKEDIPVALRAINTHTGETIERKLYVKNKNFTAQGRRIERRDTLKSEERTVRKKAKSKREMVEPSKHRGSNRLMAYILIGCITFLVILMFIILKELNQFTN